MADQGFSHVGVSTHQMDATIRFYEGILGLRRVVDSLTRLKSGGTLREVYFDIGDGQVIVFMEPRSVPGIASDYDTGINEALGVPRGMYHYAFKVGSLEALEARRQDLRRHGVDVSAIIDLGHARSIFLFDPNGIQLEYCCQTRPFDETDLHRVVDAEIAR
jgi:catechol 2,3-dioxygenase-like lactoylglutathione lyase family enzyme